jgi:Domain of unknown function (DUF6456)
MAMTRGKARPWSRQCDGGDDRFRQQHQLRVTGETEINGSRRPVLMNEAESPLGWLKSRKDRNGNPLIDDYQYEAGRCLRADYWFAHLSPRVTSNWSALAPQDREVSGILVDICCELKGLEEAEKANGWPPAKSCCKSR